MFGLFKRKGNTPQPPSLEWQLAELEKCGIRLAPERKLEDLLYSCPREDYESEPFSNLLFIMSVDVEFKVGKQDTRFSHDLFHIDLECIVESGDYVEVLAPFVALAGDDLPVRITSDFVDLEAGQAWIEYEIHGKKHRLEAEVDNDWCDPKAIEHFVALAKAHRTGNSVYIHIDNGQAFTAGYMTERNFARLRELCPSLPITRLTR